MTTITTERLSLRPLHLDDAAASTRLIADWEVIRWLTSPPWPYTLADAVEFLGSDLGGGALAITVDGEFAGVVDISDENELGYWLGIPFHGRGLMTEAAAACVDAHFAAGGGDLWSGYIIGNDASANVLTKLGFVATEICQRPSKPLAREVDLQRMELTRAMWDARQ